jgi:hypothetical protein
VGFRTNVSSHLLASLSLGAVVKPYGAGDMAVMGDMGNWNSYFGGDPYPTVASARRGRGCERGK